MTTQKIGQYEGLQYAWLILKPLKEKYPDDSEGFEVAREARDLIHHAMMGFEDLDITAVLEENREKLENPESGP